MDTCLSKRPGRNKAVSSTSGRLVAARIIIPESVPKPSISTSNWFNVFSRSSLPPTILFLPRARPIASISSINMIQGALSLAWRNKSRTRDAPTPTNISTKSDPDSEKKGTCASPATALASKVLPVPGAPINSAPFGILPPRLVYFLGFLRKSTISITACLASSKPATSLNVTETCASLSNRVALDLPILKICPPGPPPAPPDIRRIINSHTATSNTAIIIHCTNQLDNRLSCAGSSDTDIFCASGNPAWASFISFVRLSNDPAVKTY
ncbi:hypothetical protein GALL_498130 [mine drainage metagenome]|uniref:Uncharacterized protein n=1 Tax=mine drainage metagenome TaxID=410659 RepID=A0A1J5PAF7_9ZZZZ